MRQAVIDAAARLFARRGVADVALRNIAAEADVHVSLINRYVGSRDDLIRAVFNDLASTVRQYVIDHPREQHPFSRDSALGRWLTILAHWMLSGNDLADALDTANPVQAMADGLVEYNGLSPRDARIRSAQIFGSALGWRLFEPYLIAAAGLEDESITEVHDLLTAIHKRVGATPVGPAPYDPI